MLSTLYKPQEPWLPINVRFLINVGMYVFRYHMAYEKNTSLILQCLSYHG